MMHQSPEWYLKEIKLILNEAKKEALTEDQKTKIDELKKDVMEIRLGLDKGLRIMKELGREPEKKVLENDSIIKQIEAILKDL